MYWRRHRDSSCNNGRTTTSFLAMAGTLQYAELDRHCAWRGFPDLLDTYRPSRCVTSMADSPEPMQNVVECVKACRIDIGHHDVDGSETVLCQQPGTTTTVNVWRLRAKDGQQEQPTQEASRCQIVFLIHTNMIIEASEFAQHRPASTPSLCHCFAVLTRCRCCVMWCDVDQSTSYKIRIIECYVPS